MITLVILMLGATGTLMQTSGNVDSAPPVDTSYIVTEDDFPLATEDGERLRIE